MTNLLIGVGFLVFGVVVMMLGVGVAYWFYRRQVSEEEEENSRFFAEGVRDRLREDSQFVFIIVASLLGVFAQQVSLAALLFFLAGLVLTAVSVKMAPPDWIEDEEDEEDDPEPVPESDPQHIDPAGDLADAVESGDLDLSLDDDADAEDLRAFVDAAERGELGPVDPGLEAQVRIVRALLDDLDDDGADA